MTPLRPTVRAIILHQDGLILIKRTKGDRTYYVFPGGGVEEGEANEQAVIREVKEETGMDVVVDELFMEYIFEGKKGSKKELFYRCTVVGGEIGTGTGPEFQEGNGYDGAFQVMLVPLTQALEMPIFPEVVIRKIKDE